VRILQEYTYTFIEIAFEKRNLRLRDPAFWNNDSDSEADFELVEDKNFGEDIAMIDEN